MEDQLNEHAFINEPFTLEPQHQHQHHFDLLKYTSVRVLLVGIIVIFIVVRRRFISAAISNCFRSVKFFPIR